MLPHYLVKVESSTVHYLLAVSEDIQATSQRLKTHLFCRSYPGPTF